VSAFSKAELSFPILFVEQPVNLQLEKPNTAGERSLRHWQQMKNTFWV
jgi:hypothetical protein